MELDQNKIEALKAIKNANLLIQLIQENVKTSPETAVSLLNELGDNLEGLGGLDLSQLEQLKGIDGKTPVFGEDYMTGDEIDGLEQFIKENIETIGVELSERLTQGLNASQEQIRNAVSQIKNGKDGKDGKDVTKQDIEEVLAMYTVELQGSPDSPLEVVEKVKQVRGTKRLGFKNIRGLPELEKKVRDNTDDIDDLKENMKKEISIAIPKSGGGGASDFKSLIDTPSDYSGQSGLYAKVNATEDGLVFDTATGGGETNSAINIGGEVEIFKQKTGVNSELRTIKAGANVTITQNADNIEISSVGGSGGSLSDGDKGDLTVSGGGTVWTIDNDVVDYAKMQNESAHSIVGRAGSGSGDLGGITAGSDTILARNGSGDVAFESTASVKGMLSLDNVDNTSDVDKPLSTAAAAFNSYLWNQINLMAFSSQVLTDVPAGAVFTDTVYDDTAIQAEVDLNTAKVGITPAQASDITTNNAKVSANGSIDTHSDVDTSTTAPTDGQVLAWDNTSSKWKPETASSSGSSSTLIRLPFDGHHVHITRRMTIGITSVVNNYAQITGSTSWAGHVFVPIPLESSTYTGKVIVRFVTGGSGMWGFGPSSVFDSGVANAYNSYPYVFYLNFATYVNTYGNQQSGTTSTVVGSPIGNAMRLELSLVNGVSTGMKLYNGANALTEPHGTGTEYIDMTGLSYNHGGDIGLCIIGGSSFQVHAIEKT